MDEKKQPLSSKTEISMKLINLKKDRIKQKEMVSVTKDDGNKMLLFFKTPVFLNFFINYYCIATTSLTSGK